MDEFAGLIVERIVKKLREARAAAVAAQQAALAQQQARGVTPNAAAPPLVAARPVAMGVASAPVAPRSRAASRAPAPAAAQASPLERQLAEFALSDAFPTQLDGVGIAAVAAPAPDALLTAFAAGPALLGALVLGEALAPPIALRPHEAPYRR